MNDVVAHVYVTRADDAVDVWLKRGAQQERERLRLALDIPEVHQPGCEAETGGRCTCAIERTIRRILADPEPPTDFVCKDPNETIGNIPDTKRSHGTTVGETRQEERVEGPSQEDERLSRPVAAPIHCKADQCHHSRVGPFHRYCDIHECSETGCFLFYRDCRHYQHRVNGIIEDVQRPDRDPRKISIQTGMERLGFDKEDYRQVTGSLTCLHDSIEDASDCPNAITETELKHIVVATTHV